MKELVYQSTLSLAALAILSLASVPTQAASPAVKVHRSSKTGLATFVTSMDKGPISVRTTSLMAEYGHLFGIKDHSKQLRLIKSKKGSLGYSHTTYHQIHQGVRVFSGIVKVHQNSAGQATAMNGHFHPISPALVVQPGISQEQAEAVATGTSPGVQFDIQHSELVVVDPGWYGDPPMGDKLAYHVIILAQDPNVIREGFFIDAQNGEIVDRWNRLDSARNRHIYDAYGGGISGLPCRLEGQPVSEITECNWAYDYAGDAYDYFFRAFRQDGIDDLGSALQITVNYSSSQCPNDYWDGKRMLLCRGTVADDTVAHEMAHGIVENTADLIYQNQPGQLNESFADVFGEMVDMFNGNSAFANTSGGAPSWPVHMTGPGMDVPNNYRASACSLKEGQNSVRWLIAEDSLAFGGAIRDMWNPHCMGDPDRANDASVPAWCNVDNGGVHSGSSIPNHAFAMLTDGATFNGHTIIGIGPIKSAAVWYRALTVYLTISSDFLDAYSAFNQAANDLIGTYPNDPRTGHPSTDVFTASDATQVDEALMAVEMNTYGLCGCNLRVTGVMPNVAPNLGTVSVELTGSGFDGITRNEGKTYESKLTVVLVKAGQSNIFATEITAVNSNTITCKFNLSWAAAGSYNVVVTNPGKTTAVLTNGLTVADSPPGIIVESPNGGEILASDITQKIKWGSAGGSTTVNIDLLKRKKESSKKWVVVSVIAQSVPNTGTFDWIVPADLEAVTGYRIRISDGANTDESDADFTLSSCLLCDQFPSTIINDSNWTSTAGGPTIDAAGEQEPSSPFSLRFDGIPSGSDTVVSRVIDTSGYSLLELGYKFEHHDAVPGLVPPLGRDLIVEFLNAADMWVEVARHLGGTYNTNAYKLNSIQLPTAARHENFRFRIRNISETGIDGGWFVDDVAFRGVLCTAMPEAPTRPQADPPTVCPLVPSILSATVEAGDTVEWFTDGCAGTPVPGDAAPSVSPLVTTTYYARAKNSATHCVSARCSEVVVNVLSAPVAPTNAQANPPEIQLGQSAILSAIVGTGETVMWFTESGDGTLVPGGASPAVSPSVTTIYYARAKNLITGCMDTRCASVRVRVNIPPTYAGNPQPADKATVSTAPVVLQWSQGAAAKASSRVDVTAAVASIIERSGILKGTIALPASQAQDSSGVAGEQTGSGPIFDPSDGRSSENTLTRPEQVASVATASITLATIGGLNVAICSADYPEFNSDVQATLLATGKFSSVSIVNLRAVMPTLSELLAFDAVLVYSNYQYSSPTYLGDLMADYVDAGGGVVCMMFEIGTTFQMWGRWRTDKYYLISSGYSRNIPATLGTIHVLGHPLLEGVTSFNGGDISLRPSSSTVSPGSVRVADWSDGKPLIVTKIIGDTPRVDLAFFPPSNTVLKGLWDSTTDGALLMANALTFVAENWTCATTYDVYLDTANPPTTQVGSDLAKPICNSPMGLSVCKTYYWKVVAKNCGGTTEGPVWSFTINSLGMPENPRPANGAEPVSVNTVLSWTSGLSTTNAPTPVQGETCTTTYDVYLDATNPPTTKLCSSLSKTVCDSAKDLAPCNSTYYWKVIAKNCCGSVEGPVWSFRLPDIARTAGDFDGDCDVDERDMVMFFAPCVAGSLIEPSDTPLCRQADFDHDNDVDMDDFAVLQRCFSGENRAADPNCVN